MSARKQIKDTTTLFVGVPLAFAAATVATVVLVLEWIGVSAIERLIRQR
jgi:hypothetical protein